jgi:hypothetical protein
MAAVAFELDIDIAQLPPQSSEAIRRGARYLNFELLDIAS